MTTLRYAAIYARVSSEQQKKKGSLENQLEKCRAYAEDLEFTVLPEHEFVDAFTGTTLDRPQLNAVKALVGKVEAIFFHVTDRFSRAGVLDTANLALWFEDHGTAVYFTDLGKVNMHNDDEVLELQVNVRAAMRERENIVRRTSQGRYDRVKAGKLYNSGRSYYGYDYIPAENRFKINEAEKQWVEKIFYWHGVERLGTLQIANRLRDSGVPTKLATNPRLMGKAKRVMDSCKWSTGVISRMLKATIYKGIWTYGKTSKGEQRGTINNPDIVPRIVSDELWEQCQNVSRDNRKYNNVGGQTYPALLTGRLHCATCNRPFSQRHDARNGHRYYECCGQRRIYAPDGKNANCFGAFDLCRIDEQVWNALAHELRSPGRIIEGFKAEHEGKEAKRREDREFLERCKSELANLDTREAQNEELWRKGIWTIERLKEDAANVMHQRQMRLDKIAQLESSLAQQLHDEMSLDAFERYCKDISNGLDIMNAEEKRALVQAMNVQAIIYRGSSVKRRRTWFPTGKLSLMATVPLDIMIDLTSEDVSLTPFSYETRKVHSSLAFSLTIELDKAA